MNFLIKAFAQKLLSSLPRSADMNYFFQKHVTKTMPISNGSFHAKIAEAGKHLAFFEQYAEGVERNSARFYEFGAGWNLIVPIVFSMSGIKSQVITDYRVLARLDLVNDTISRMKSCKSRIEGPGGMRLEANIPNMRNVTTTSDLLQEYGIAFLAPRSASSTGLPSDSFDFVSNTVTFEHIPEGDIVDVFQECFRILKPNGLMSCCIDLRDHCAQQDKSISIYNFLKYSDLTWRIINSSLAFQNRLRFADYLEMIERKTEFIVLQIEKEEPDEADLEVLIRLKLNKHYRFNYSKEDLGVKTAWLALRKPGPQGRPLTA
jgi:SAM-dependent methyltransferase